MSHALIVIGWLLAAQAGPPAATTADEIASKSFEKRAFPWFDSEKQAFKPLKPPTRPSDGWLSEFLDWLFGSAGNSTLSLLARICIILVLVAVLVWLGYLFYLSLEFASPAVVVEEKIATLNAAQLEALPAAVRSVTDFLAEAKRLAQEGDFNSAIVFYYSWQLVTLNEAGTVELELGKTNRQYIREVTQNREELRELFVRSTRLFEDAFYGNMSLQRESFLAVWESRDQFHNRSIVARRRQ
jgi:hypothetical protein